jgi:Tol biopolymer transport system component
VALLCAVGLSASAADAAFPGANARIAFDSTRSGAVNIFTVDPNNLADVRMITDSSNLDEVPYGSPDGTKVVFRSDRTNPGNGQGNIYVSSALANLDQLTFPPDGATPLTTGGADDKDPSFLDDDHVVYSHKAVGGRYELFTVVVSSAVSTPLLSSPVGCDDAQAVVNPANPNLLAFTRTCSPQGDQLYLLDRSQPSSPTNPINLTAANNVAAYPVLFDAEADWAPDGSRIAVAGRGAATLFGGLRQLYSIKPDGTDRQVFWPSLVAGTGKNDRFPSYSPDGTKLAFTRQQNTTGTDVWTTELSTLTAVSVAGAPSDITPSRGPDQHPTWLRNVGDAPPPIVPEAPLVPMLAVSAMLIGAGMVLRQRRISRSFA